MKLSQLNNLIHRTSFEIEIEGRTEKVEFEFRDITPELEKQGVVELLRRSLVRIQDGEQDGQPVMTAITDELISSLPFRIHRLLYDAIIAHTYPKKVN
ncbi:MAG: hypothetical protein U0Z53_23725 [Blastocatellia bacterium]